MANKKRNILKFLAVAALCALMSVITFAGCANKTMNEPESPEVEEYGLYTNLTLSLDSGEGKVWATVTNTFTFLPSTVRVTVELYRSDSFKGSYKQMELANSNTVSDLNIGKTLTAEAETGGRQAYWQARMFYKIDEQGWQERTTNIWQIKGDGNIVTTNATAPTLLEGVLPEGEFIIKDIINGMPEKITVYKPEISYKITVKEYDELGNLTNEIPTVTGSVSKDTEVEQEINQLYNYFSSVTFKAVRVLSVSHSIGSYSVEMDFSDCFIKLTIVPKDNDGKGVLFGYYYNNDGYNNDGQTIGLITDLQSIEYEKVCAYIESIM